MLSYFVKLLPFSTAERMASAMIKIKKAISANCTSLLADYLKNPEQVLFFDIETTGFSPKSASIYLIGAAACENGTWTLYQWFSQTPSEEKQILENFFSFASSFQHLIHFNGTTFDIPFLQAKAKRHAIPEWELPSQTDIYRLISPLKNLLRLPGCKQKNLEQFLGIFREDPFHGGQLIELYRAYTENQDERLLKVLLLHNEEDIIGMLSIYPITAYAALFRESFSQASAQIESCENAKGETGKELLLTVVLPLPIPKSFSCHKNGCFFLAEDQKGIFKVPVYEGELKYFYPDYKNYSYLPDEDKAIHKSVAVYVDKNHRQPATAATCYTRKYGDFLPQYRDLFQPVFRAEYKAKESYFLPDRQWMSSQENLCSYAEHLLKQLAM